MALTVAIATTPEITATQPGDLIGISAISASLSPGAENTNCSITLDNGDGRYSALFSSPPLGIICRVIDGTETIFEGVITGVTLGSTAELEAES